MTIQELLEKNEKATLIIQKFYMDKLVASLNSDIIAEDYKEFVRAKGFSIEDLARIIDSSPRSLFDVFDDNGIYIEILVDYTTNPLFTYVINDDVMGNVEAILYNSRKDADMAAVAQAFELLNEKL